MNIFSNIKIKKRSQPIWLILFIIMMPFLFGLLLDFLKLPSALKYSLDVACIVLLVLMVLNINHHRIKMEKSFLPVCLWILAFLLFTAIVYIFNFQSPLYYLWGIRNNFRFYAFLILCILFLNRDDIKDIFKLFDFLFWVNSAVCCIQYFVFGIYRDYLGGLFGVEKGCNGYLNIFLIIYAAKTIVFYLNKHENLLSMLSKTAIILFVSALAELKFLYIEFIIIIMVAVLISNFSWRKLWVIIGGFTGVILAISLLELLFPNFINFFTLERILQNSTVSGYSGTEELNRLTAIPQLSKGVLTDTSDKLFGLGLGNCDTAAYDFLKTPFYLKYANIKYHWFSTSFLFVETGFIGLSFYLGFFVLIFVLCMKYKKQVSNNGYDASLYQISAIIALLSVAVTVYNSSLRTEAGYLICFILAIPFIVKKEGRDVYE